MTSAEDLIEQIRHELAPIEARLRDQPYLQALDQSNSEGAPQRVCGRAVRRYPERLEEPGGPAGPIPRPPQAPVDFQPPRG